MEDGNELEKNGTRSGSPSEVYLPISVSQDLPKPRIVRRLDGSIWPPPTLLGTSVSGSSCAKYTVLLLNP